MNTWRARKRKQNANKCSNKWLHQFQADSKWGSIQLCRFSLLQRIYSSDFICWWFIQSSKRFNLACVQVTLNIIWNSDYLAWMCISIIIKCEWTTRCTSHTAYFFKWNQYVCIPATSRLDAPSIAFLPCHNQPTQLSIVRFFRLLNVLLLCA